MNRKSLQRAGYQTAFIGKWHMGYQSLLNERWKLIHFTDLRDMDELYDLQSDPYEMKNLIGDPRSYEILESLRVRLNKLVGRI